MAEPRFFSGSLDGKGLRIGIVVSRFNSFISDKLLEGALDALERHGTETKSIDVARVPGAFDLPLIAKKMASSGRYDAICALGCVIRGDTPHFEYVAAQAARGVAQASVDSGVPVSFGVLTTDTVEQAIERAGTKAGNKGADAAVAAIEMARVIKALSEGS